METIILGHMNPDTDSILSAIALQDLMTKRGVLCKAFAQGNPTPDAQWALDTFGFATPEIISSVKEKNVILVDTTETEQLPEDINQATITMVVDHHKLGKITTAHPFEAWIRPVGCSATIVKEIYDAYAIAIPKNIAGIMLAAILNDTVIFKSPTTTPTDIKTAKELACIAEIDDIEDFGKQMFIVKSNLNDTPQNLLFRDFKNFDIHGKSFGIGQLELIDLKSVEPKTEDLLDAMNQVKKEKSLETVILVLTDIMKEGSELLVTSDDVSFIEKTFKTKITNGKSDWLSGVMSRKKQIIPALMENNS